MQKFFFTLPYWLPIGASTLLLLGYYFWSLWSSFKAFIVKLSSCIHCCYKILFASSCINLLLLLTSPRFYEALTSNCTCKRYCFLVALFWAGTFKHIIASFAKTLGLSDQCDLWEGIPFIDILIFSFSNPQVTEDVSLGPSSLNRKRYLIKLTVIG